MNAQIRILRPTRGTWVLPVLIVTPVALYGILWSLAQSSVLNDSVMVMPVSCVAAPFIPVALAAAAWPRSGRAMRRGITWAAAFSIAISAWIFRPDLAVRVIHYQLTETAFAAASAPAVEMRLAIVASPGAEPFAR